LPILLLSGGDVIKARNLVKWLTIAWTVKASISDRGGDFSFSDIQFGPTAYSATNALLIGDPSPGNSILM
jgi:hypothetical protein